MNKRLFILIILKRGKHLFLKVFKQVIKHESEAGIVIKLNNIIFRFNKN